MSDVAARARSGDGPVTAANMPEPGEHDFCSAYHCCDDHPIGKPWGWNFLAWERHYYDAHEDPDEAGREAHAAVIAESMRHHEIVRSQEDW